MSWQLPDTSGGGLLLAVLGDPVGQSLSPRMHEAAMKSAGVEGSYFAIQVGAEDFENAIRSLRAAGFSGVNITIPHKQAAAAAADERDGTVIATDSANTLTFREGIAASNTDVPGFLEPLQGVDPGEALLIGSGGAARSVAYALTSSGWEVVVRARSWERGNELVARFNKAGTIRVEDKPNLGRAALIVNATPLGLRADDAQSVDLSSAESNSIVYDLAYRDGRTKLLAEAEAKGMRTIDGREMLVAQGALSFKTWTGISPDRAAMKEAVGL